jgi:nucleoside-diphosphate-sugar epimerase
MSAARPIYLVTGALGCIGAWVLYHLTRQGHEVISYDLSDDRHRLDLLLSPLEQKPIRCVRGDLANLDQLAQVMQTGQVTHVIHLGALQVPFCRANPSLGAQVNVTGTINVFEAARQSGIRHISYASSIAVYGPPAADEMGRLLEAAPLAPATLYGVYKVANEGAARVYWQEHNISSVALRPYTVYGVGRDQGMTSDPTKAMLAAAAGKPYHIAFNGPCQYHYTSDVARLFIAAASTPLAGARAYNLGGPPVTSAEMVDMIRAVVPNAQLTHAAAALPFPAGMDGGDLQRAFPFIQITPLAEGIRKTIERFARLLEAGRLRWEDPA